MKERGIALISALMIGMTLVLIGVGITGYILSGGKLFSRVSQQEDALNVAESGLEWAVTHFDPDTPQVTATAAPFGKGEYEISPASPLVPNERYMVRVDAYLPSKENPRFHRAIQGIIQASPAPIFDHALAAGGNISLSGNITVHSSPNPHEGHVHANGDIISTGGSLSVDGETSAHGTDTLGNHSNAPAIEIPALTAAKLRTFYQLASATRTTSFDAFGGGVFQGYYAPASTWDPMTVSHTTFAPTGDLTIPSGSVVFVDGDLKLSGNTTITGGGTIVVNGKVAITGNVSLAQRGQLSIVSTSTADDAIAISGNIAVGSLPGETASPPPGDLPSAIFFTPNGGITMTGNPSVYGSLIAGENGDVKGNADITRISERTSGVQGFATWRMVNWRELK